MKTWCKQEIWLVRFCKIVPRNKWLFFFFFVFLYTKTRKIVGKRFCVQEKQLFSQLNNLKSLPWTFDDFQSKRRGKKKKKRCNCIDEIFWKKYTGSQKKKKKYRSISSVLQDWWHHKGFLWGHGSVNALNPESTLDTWVVIWKALLETDYIFFCHVVTWHISVGGGNKLAELQKAFPGQVAPHLSSIVGRVRTDF